MPNATLVSQTFIFRVDPSPNIE